MSNVLASLDDIKAFTEITSSKMDSLLTLILESVSAKIEKYLNRSLAKIEYTEYFNGGRKYFYVSAPPIDSGSAITVTVSGNTGYSEDSEFYVWHDMGGVEFVSAPTENRPKQVAITYTGGYTVTDSVIAVPTPLKYACILQTSFEFRRRKDIGLDSLTLPDGAVSVPDRSDFIDEVEAILKKYRKNPTRI